MRSTFRQFLTRALQRMRNEVLQQQVKELKAMVAEVRDAMRLFPVPAREPERMVVMEHGGFLNISPGDSAFATLQRVTQEGAQKWKVSTNQERERERARSACV